MPNLNVTLQGRGDLVLRDSDYVTSGGEGKIYKPGDTIVKIFHDKDKMTKDNMVPKIELLSKNLSDPSIMKPQGVVYAKTNPVGFYMRFVEGEPLARFFVTDFWKKNGFDFSDAIKLISKMRDVFLNAHDNGVLTIDANELNWIINKKTPHVIDVDSWTPDIRKWPATVIMPSIRDWHAKEFSEQTDWFAWGIVAFQVMTGIHPYKGTAPGYSPKDFLKRMQDNVSLFEPGVRVPQNVRDFSNIPGHLMDWFQAEFKNKERTIPPSPLDGSKPAKAAQVQRITVSFGSGLRHEKIFQGTDTMIRVWPCGIGLSASGTLVDITNKRPIFAIKELVKSEVVKFEGGWLVVDYENDKPVIIYTNGITRDVLPLQMMTKFIFRSDNNLFAITSSEMIKLDIKNFSKKVLTLGKRWQVRSNSTKFLENFAVQDVLGAKYLVIPIGESALKQIRVKELDGITVLSGKFGHRFAVLSVVDSQGNYSKFELTFNSDFSSYTFWQGNTDNPDLNMVILPNGVTAGINTDGELTIFVPTNGKVSKVKDHTITTDLTLYSIDSKVLYLRDGDVWHVSTI